MARDLEEELGKREPLERLVGHYHANSDQMFSTLYAICMYVSYVDAFIARAP